MLATTAMATVAAVGSLPQTTYPKIFPLALAYAAANANAVNRREGYHWAKDHGSVANFCEGS